MKNTQPKQEAPANHAYRYDHALCLALKFYCQDSKAWAKAYLDHIKNVILAGVK